MVAGARRSRARLSRAVAARRPSPPARGAAIARSNARRPLRSLPGRCWTRPGGRGAARPDRGSPGSRDSSAARPERVAASSNRCSACAMPPSMAWACTSPHESPSGVRMPTASSASRVAAAVSPTMIDAVRREQQARRRLPLRAQLSVVARLAAALASTSSGDPAGSPGRPGAGRRPPRARRRRARRRSRAAASRSACASVDVAGRRLEPAGQQQRRRPLRGGRAASARRAPARHRRCRRRAPPRSSRTRWRCVRRAAGRAPRTRPAPRRCWPARPGRSRGTRAVARRGRWRRTSAAVAAYQPACAAAATSACPDSRSRSRGIGPDAVEQPVADLPAARRVHADQRPVHQPGDRVEHRGRGDVEGREHVLDRVQRGAARRSTTAPTGHAGRRGRAGRSSSAIAPASARGARAVAARVPQQGEPVVEPAGDVPHRQRPHPRRGQLDRQRQAVQRATHLLDEPASSRRRARTPGASPVRASANSATESSLDSGSSWWTCSSVDTQRHLAGGQDRSVGAHVEQRVDQRADAVDHVLAVVEHQHRLGTGQSVEQRLLAAGDLEGLGDHLRGRRSRRRRPDAPARRRPGPSAAAGHLERQTGLADTGRTDDRHQPVRLEPATRARRGRRLATDQRRRRAGQVAGATATGVVPAVAERGALLQHLLLQRRAGPARARCRAPRPAAAAPGRTPPARRPADRRGTAR